MGSNNQYGWVCPICGKVNAPWVPNCTCKPSGILEEYTTEQLKDGYTVINNDDSTNISTAYVKHTDRIIIN